jgi:hypothetical protein
MSDSHLAATIGRWERLAEEGVRVRSGGGHDSEDMWYDDDVLYGAEALEYLGYADYTAERDRRSFGKPSDSAP